MQTCWTDFDVALKHLRTVYLWGPPGLGKTSAALASLDTYLGKRGQASMITMSEDLVVQEIMGHYLPGKNGEMSWHNGPVTDAIKGGALVVNEMARASGAVLDAMLAVMDGQRVARISLPSGETIVPWDGFKLVATANSNVDQLDPALKDRFETIIKIDIPHPSIIKVLNDGMPMLGDLLFDSYKDPARALSVRQCLTLVKFLTDGADKDTAWRLSFGARWKDVVAALKLKRAGKFTKSALPKAKRTKTMAEVPSEDEEDDDDD